jgi:hypothetical protein
MEIFLFNLCTRRSHLLLRVSLKRSTAAPQKNTSRSSGGCLLDRLHLDSDAVDRLPRSVEDPSGRLRRHIHNQIALTLPRFDRQLANRARGARARTRFNPARISPPAVTSGLNQGKSRAFYGDGELRAIADTRFCSVAGDNFR